MDLHALTFQAGTRALGLIDKLVTGPLWREIEKGHVMELTKVYVDRKFAEWAQDASKILTGDDILFLDHTTQGDILESLTTPSPLLDPLTKQALVLIFGSLCLVCARQTKDHLSAGMHETWALENVAETKSVPKSNVWPERVWVTWLLETPNTKSNWYCHRICHDVRVNHTADWLQALNEESPRNIWTSTYAIYSGRWKWLWCVPILNRTKLQRKRNV